MRELKLDTEIEEMIEFYVKYGTVDDIGSVFSKLKHRKYKTLRKSGNSESEIAKIDLGFRKYVKLVQSMYKPFDRMRCPECGNKLSTRRCLMCDMKRGVVKDLPSDPAR